MDVEVKMRIPAVTMRSADAPAKRIVHNDVRFTKRMSLPIIPQPGALLQLTTRSGPTLDCTVARTDWQEARGLFVVSCRYVKRTMSAEEYRALTSDADWTRKALMDGL